MPLRSSVPRLPLHLSAAALHTLSPAAQPLVGRRAYTRTIFPIPTRLSLSLLLLARHRVIFRTRFLYLLREFTDQRNLPRPR